MNNKPIIQQFQDDLNELVRKYNDSGLNLGAAVGVIELVKLDLWYMNQGDDEGSLLDEETPLF